MIELYSSMHDLGVKYFVDIENCCFNAYFKLDVVLISFLCDILQWIFIVCSTSEFIFYL